VRLLQRTIRELTKRIKRLEKRPGGRRWEMILLFCTRSKWSWRPS
jgi:hypothetical protein